MLVRLLAMQSVVENLHFRLLAALLLSTADWASTFSAAARLFNGLRCLQHILL